MLGLLLLQRRARSREHDIDLLADRARALAASVAATHGRECPVTVQALRRRRPYGLAVRGISGR